VPLPGGRSSLVWVERPETAASLEAMDDAALGRAIEARSHGLRGRIRIASRRWLYPLRGLLAHRLHSGPVALVGEAAHALPPIAAQGLNLGLRDAAALAGALGQAKREGGDLVQALAGYDHGRRADLLSRTLAVDLLNRSLLGGLLPLQLGRSAGLGLLRAVGPLRRAVMRQGVAPGLA